MAVLNINKIIQFEDKIKKLKIKLKNIIDNRYNKC